jgi:SAM-dependent methyltransferase
LGADRRRERRVRASRGHSQIKQEGRCFVLAAVRSARRNPLEKTRMKILIGIASYGSAQDQLLLRLIEEYRSMSFEVDIVVLSNVQKEIVPGVEVVAGLPDEKDPWSLIYAHKALFAERLEKYDLFLHSENDILVTERNIRAFLEVSQYLNENETPGFFRYEIGSAGEMNFPEAHAGFHWDEKSVVTRGPYTLAFFTNEHAACYLLTREQLRRAIQTGNYLVAPHFGKYNLPESASTDPFTQCGFRKLVCISHLDDFLVHHLSNRYVKRLGVERPEFQKMIDALMAAKKNPAETFALFPTETRLKRARYSKDYYEAVRPDVVALVPPGARSVLSLGCGSGETEEWLAKKGLRVAAVPLDSVISSWPEARGIEVIRGGFKEARRKLEGQRFDCLLLSNVLHLVGDPAAVIASFAGLLSDNGAVIALVPNLLNLPMLRKRIRFEGGMRAVRGDYQANGVHFTSRGVLRGWFRRAGMKVETIATAVPAKFETIRRLTLGLCDSLLAEDLIVVAKKGRAQPALATSAEMAQAVKRIS